MRSSNVVQCNVNMDPAIKAKFVDDAWQMKMSMREYMEHLIMNAPKRRGRKRAPNRSKVRK